MGCELSGTEDRRSLVLGGAGTSYQCLGAEGSSSGHSDLYIKDRTPTHSSEDRLCNSKSLHQSCWGDSLSNPQFNSIGHMEMVSRSSPLLDSRVSPRSGEFSGRQGVQAARRQLDASPTSFQAHKRDPRSSGSGPVCIQADPSVTKVFQLETRPSSRSNRCTDAELGADLWICEPSLMPDTDSPDKDPSRERKGGSGGPSMEDPTRVSIASRSVVQCSSPTTTEGGPGDFTSRKGIHYAYGSPTSSRMAIVREQCRSRGLSSTAS